MAFTGFAFLLPVGSKILQDGTSITVTVWNDETPSSHRYAVNW